MKKLLVIAISVLLTGPVLARMIVEKEEYTANDLVKDTALQNYYISFLNYTKNYNAISGDREKLAASFSDVKEQHKFYRWLTANGIKSLPKAHITNGIATIKIGKNKLQYSVETMLKDSFIYNGKLIEVSKLSFTESLEMAKKVANLERKYTFIDLIIPTAHAEASEALEKTLIATLLYINTDFAKRKRCIFCGDENKNVTKKNIDKMLAQAKSLLNACENEDLDIDEVYNNIERFVGLDDNGGFRSSSATVLKSYFPSIQRQLKDVTCENLVADTYLENEKFSLIELTGRRYRSTVSKDERRRAEVAKYNKVVQDKCNIIAELNSCMLSSYWTVEDIYNAGRDPGQKKYREQAPSRTYRVRATSK